MPPRAVERSNSPLLGRFLPHKRSRLTITERLYKLYVMESLDAGFFALSDATRRAIVARLARGEATVMELAEPFAMTQPAISRHLKVLESAGLIARRIDGTKRPCRLEKKGMKAMEQWLAMMRKALAKNFDRLDDVLATLNRETKGAKS